MTNDLEIACAPCLDNFPVTVGRDAELRGVSCDIGNSGPLEIALEFAGEDPQPTKCRRFQNPESRIHLPRRCAPNLKSCGDGPIHTSDTEMGLRKLGNLESVETALMFSRKVPISDWKYHKWAHSYGHSTKFHFPRFQIPDWMGP